MVKSIICKCVSLKWLHFGDGWALLDAASIVVLVLLFVVRLLEFSRGPSGSKSQVVHHGEWWLDVLFGYVSSLDLRGFLLIILSQLLSHLRFRNLFEAFMERRLETRAEIVYVLVVLGRLYLLLVFVALNVLKVSTFFIANLTNSAVGVLFVR